VALRIPFFIPAVFAIRQTDLILTVPRTLAKIVGPLAGLRVIEPPREIKPFPYFMSWPPRLSNEAAHTWLREQVRAVRKPSAANKRTRVPEPAEAGGLNRLQTTTSG
jgi:DNA-binding transcriptional LysR family regulator